MGLSLRHSVIFLTLTLLASTPAHAGFLDRLFKRATKPASCDAAVTETLALLEGKTALEGRPYVNVSEVTAPLVATEPEAQALKQLSEELHHLPPGEAWAHSPEGFDYVLHDGQIYVRQSNGAIFHVQDPAAASELAGKYLATAEKTALINRRAHAVEQLFGGPLPTSKIGGGGCQLVHSLEGSGKFPKAILDRIPALKGRRLSDFVLKIPTADEAKTATLFARDREMYGAIEGDVNKSGGRLLKTYFYEDSNGTRFVLQEKLPPGTRSFADTVDGFLGHLVPPGEYDPYLRREMFAAEIRGLPLTDPKYKFWGVDTSQLAAIRARPEYQRFLNEMRSARSIADGPRATSIAEAYRERGLLLTNIMAWHDAESMANVDFSWENGRVLPNGQIVWFDF